RRPVRDAAHPPPGVVPAGLPLAARAAWPWRDPPGRGRAPAAHRSAPRARAAGEHGGHGKACARAINQGTAFGNFPQAASEEKTVTVSTTYEEQEAGGGVMTSYRDAPTRTVSAGGVD